jgi:hypothetical protein
MYRQYITDVDNMSSGALHNVLVFYVNGAKASAQHDTLNLYNFRVTFQ